MAAEERDEPLVGRVLAEPQWQNHHHFPVPKYSSNYGSSGAGKWKWPPVDHQRIEDLTPELWGEGEMQKDKEGVEREVFKCDICLKFREKTRFHPLRGCEHKPYCSKCVGRNAREELHGKGQIKMKCPFLACEVKYEPDDIQRTCCRRDYDRFCSLSTNKMLETIEDFRHCTNKRNGCGSGQLHDAGEDGKYNIVTCHSCGWSTCYIHKEQMHFGLTCEEYDVWKDASRTLARLGSGGDEEELTKALLHQKSRQCPDCRVLISKVGTFDADDEDEACHHMTCENQLNTGVCGAEFCWLCGAYYYGGDPSKRARVRKCEDPEHHVSLRGHGGTLLHCHHKAGCARA